MYFETLNSEVFSLSQNAPYYHDIEIQLQHSTFLNISQHLLKRIELFLKKETQCAKKRITL